MKKLNTIQVPLFVRLLAAAGCLVGLSFEVLSGHGVPCSLQSLSIGAVFSPPFWVGDTLLLLGVAVCAVLWMLDLIACKAGLRKSLTALVLAIILSLPVSLSAAALHSGVSHEIVVPIDTVNFIKALLFLCPILAVSLYNILSSCDSAHEYRMDNDSHN
ncbi:MAG: hypothetical protein IJ524_02100 [Bacteroidales bacterium]|nr:hypothetical protein [Bacteroidales bacterium]